MKKNKSNKVTVFLFDNFTFVSGFLVILIALLYGLVIGLILSMCILRLFSENIIVIFLPVPISFCITYLFHMFTFKSMIRILRGVSIYKLQKFKNFMKYLIEVIFSSFIMMFPLLLSLLPKEDANIYFNNAYPIFTTVAIIQSTLLHIKYLTERIIEELTKKQIN